jgi:hypothetical protein
MPKSYGTAASTFEALVSTTFEPPPPSDSHAIQRKADSILFMLPGKKILSLLPKSSLLNIRLVSFIMKVWVENERKSLFSILHISFPLSPQDWVWNPAPSPLQRIAAKCEFLVFHVNSSTTALRSPHNILKGLHSLPQFTALTHLRIITPYYDSFYPLLEARAFLQAVEPPLLRHLAVDGLSIEGVEALRWGPFSAYFDSDWNGSTVWRRLTSLEICLTPWTGVEDLTKSVEGMQGIKILHDWLGSFGGNKFEKVRFEWAGDWHGPNPFLLDEWAELDDAGEMIDMALIRWTGCKEIWLGGVSLGPDDVESMVERIKGLQKLAIWRTLFRRKTETEEWEERVVNRGREWLVMDVERAVENIRCARIAAYEQETEAMAEILRQNHDGIITKDQDEIGGGKEKEKGNKEKDDEELHGDDDNDTLSDGSREVPIFLDMRYE